VQSGQGTATSGTFVYSPAMHLYTSMYMESCAGSFRVDQTLI